MLAGHIGTGAFSARVPAMDLKTNFELNDRYCYTIKETETHLVEIQPMIFNDRVVLTPKTCLDIYECGWCFDKGGAAFYAAVAWDPDTEAEPVGYKKRVGF